MMTMWIVEVCLSVCRPSVRPLLYRAPRPAGQAIPFAEQQLIWAPFVEASPTILIMIMLEQTHVGRVNPTLYSLQFVIHPVVWMDLLVQSPISDCRE